MPIGERRDVAEEAPAAVPEAVNEHQVDPRWRRARDVLRAVLLIDAARGCWFHDDAVDDVVGIGVAHARVVRVPLEPLR